MTRSKPSSFAASTALSSPGGRRSPPSRLSSPMCATSASCSVGRCPEAASADSAIARSKPDPCFGRAAGLRLTISKRSLSGIPACWVASLTRCFASASAASGSPMITMPGSWFDTAASTCTIVPSSPVSATAAVRHTPGLMRSLANVRSEAPRWRRTSPRSRRFANLASAADAREPSRAAACASGSSFAR